MWLAVAAYVLAQMAIGVWASRRVRNETDYLIAGRSLGLGLTAVSLFATWFGAETVMGSAAAVAEQGLAGSRTDPFGYALCLVLMALVIAGRMRAGGYVTLGDFFASRFGPSVERVAVLVIVPTSVMWAAAQLFAFGQILTVVADVPVATALAAAAVLVIGYCLLGGLLGDVLTDLVQAVILIVGLVILLGFVFAASGGISAGLARIEASQLSFIAPDETLWAQLDTWAVPILGSLVAQEALSRLLATRSVRIARTACWLAAGIYFAIGLVPVMIALIGSHLGLDLDHRDGFLPVLARELLPPVLYVVLIGALISAILSTVDSAILSAAGLVEHNLISRAVPGLTDRQRLLVARGCVVLAGLAAWIIATGGDTIYGLVEMASSFGSAGVLVATLVGLWSGFGGAHAAMAALVAGIAMTAATDWLGWITVDAPYLLAIAASLLAYAAAAALDRRST